MELKKVKPQKLEREIYQAFENVVGPEWISEDRAIVEVYSKTPSWDSGMVARRKQLKDPSCLPACVILPATTEEVQGIMRVASRHRIPLFPFTNGQNWASQADLPGTVVLHMRRMDKILDIDEESMTATVQPFVSYAQLQADTMKRGLWNGGTPLATSITKLASQFGMAGYWQTDIKFGGMSLNAVDATCVLPDGSVLKTGASTTPGVGRFFALGPGPDLLSLLRSSIGAFGVFTEVTVKLHPWVGEPSFPEDVGRPSISTYFKAVEENEASPGFDRPPVPKRHRLFWIEFPDMDSEIEAFYKISQSGIGIGVNASGVYNDFYCSQTEEMAERRHKEQFFPPYNIYVCIAGISSERQIEYEEKVLMDIIEETGGKLLSKEHKPEVLEALAPWNQDVFRHVTGFRMNRPGGFGGLFPMREIDVNKTLSEMWKGCLERNPDHPHHMDDGGAAGISTPFVYSSGLRGHWGAGEVDFYYSQADIKSIEAAIKLFMDGQESCVRETKTYGIANMLSEPFTTQQGPGLGPNVHLLFRKLKKVFDPLNICNPRKLVYTEEDLEKLDENFKKDFGLS